jgi:hypothetical protein
MTRGKVRKEHFLKCGKRTKVLKFYESIRYLYICTETVGPVLKRQKYHWNQSIMCEKKMTDVLAFTIFLFFTLLKDL